MLDRALLESVGRTLREAPSVVISAHVDPDGDAVGSCLGLSHALDVIGVPNVVVLASGKTVPSTYAFLPGSDRYRDPATVAAPAVFVSLDAPHRARLGAAEPLAAAAQSVVLIDHHPDAAPEGTINLLDPSAAATGSIVWALLPYLGLGANPDIATCLYAALLTDTGRFSYANTTAETLRTAADMVVAGADPHEIYRSIYENRSAGAQQLVGRVLSRVTLANSGRVAYSWITGSDFAETGALPEESENLVDYIRALGGIDVAVLVKVNADSARGSLRAKTDADVGAAARALGGGGHRAAAGVTVAGNLESFLAALLPLLPGAA